MPVPFGNIDAFLIIDMRNSFCHPDGVSGRAADMLEFGAGDLVVDKANACMETTVRAATMRDYHVTVLSDCTTSPSRQSYSGSASDTPH